MHYLSSLFDQRAIRGHRAGSSPGKGRAETIVWLPVAEWRIRTSQYVLTDLIDVTPALIREPLLYGNSQTISNKFAVKLFIMEISFLWPVSFFPLLFHRLIVKHVSRHMAQVLDTISASRVSAISNRNTPEYASNMDSYNCHFPK